MGFNDLLIQTPLVSAKETIDYSFDQFYYNVDSFNVQFRFLNMNYFQ